MILFDEPTTNSVLTFKVYELMNWGQLCAFVCSWRGKLFECKTGVRKLSPQPLNFFFERAFTIENVYILSLIALWGGFGRFNHHPAVHSRNGIKGRFKLVFFIIRGFSRKWRYDFEGVPTHTSLRLEDKYVLPKEANTTNVGTPFQQAVKFI